MIKRNKKKQRVIPGFGVSLGVTITILSMIVVIPLCSLVIFSAHLSAAEFIKTVTSERVVASYAVSFLTAFVASAINAVMGLIIAWVLVRYQFPGKRVLDGIIEIPFALPTKPLSVVICVSEIPATAVGSANGISMMPSNTRLPGN